MIDKKGPNINVHNEYIAV